MGEKYLQQFLNSKFCPNAIGKKCFGISKSEIPTEKWRYSSGTGFTSQTWHSKSKDALIPNFSEITKTLAKIPKRAMLISSEQKRKVFACGICI